ncbi:MAG: AI-2E family transporter [Desulfobacteraceae bacterium]|jgi:predicted PurR-regulated permease PerM
MKNTTTIAPPPWDRIFQFSNRLLVWGILCGVVFFLKSFFLLMFMTFVFSYIQTRSVTRLKPLIKNRSARVLLVAFLFLGIMTGIGLFIVPEVKNQTEMFVKQFGTYVARVDQEIIFLSERYPVLKEAIPQLKLSTTDVSTDAAAAPPVSFSPTTSIFQEIIGMGEDAEGTKITQLFDRAQNIGKGLVAIASAFLLALLFSFLIVFDLPSLTEHVRSLERTRLKFIYEEVADGIYNFSRVLGQAFEAQFFIALLNTLLTAIGIFIIGLGNHVAFLCMIVFLCSFVPVVGVFISSVPICLIALQLMGLKTMFFAIILIIVIHLIEGYILNPRIYGSRMRINPVIVLFILTIGGKLFHIWGLVLGVPVFSYISGHAIQLQKDKNKDKI